VGLLAVALVILWAEFLPDRDLPTKWIAFGLSSVITFGYPVYWTRGIPKRSSFWFLWSAFTILHCIIFIPILFVVEKLPYILFVVVAFGEMYFFCPILYRQFQMDEKLHKPSIEKNHRHKAKKKRKKS